MEHILGWPNMDGPADPPIVKHVVHFRWLILEAVGLSSLGESVIRRLWVSLVGLFNLLLFFEKPKANQKAKTSYVLLVQTSFCLITNSKAPFPLLSVAFEAKNYPPCHWL